MFFVKNIEQLKDSLIAIVAVKGRSFTNTNGQFLRKYADIIVNLQMKNDSYSLIKRFDDNTLDQIRSRFDKKKRT